MTRHTIFVSTLLLLAAFALPSRADTVYTYTGNTFDIFKNGNTCPTLCNVFGSFTVAQPLAADLLLVNTSITPLSYSLSSGNFTITSGTLSLGVQTDNLGNIVQWVFFGLGPTNGEFARILAENIPGSIVADDVRFGTNSGPFPGPIAAELLNSPGKWTSTNSVPEPSSILILAVGMLALLGFTSRKKLIVQS
jgi:hypothetical protein